MNSRHARPALPFALHQIVEYLAGLVALLQAIHDPVSAPWLAGTGTAVVLVAAVTDGPLGAGRLISRELHRALDVAFVLVLGTLPFVVHAQLSGVAFATLLGMAALFFWLPFSTRYQKKERRERLMVRARIDDTVQAGSYRLGLIAGRAAAQGPRALGRTAGRILQKRKTLRSSD